MGIYKEIIMRKCPSCGRDIPLLRSACPYHWDDMDFGIGKIGVIFKGIFTCVLIAMGLPLVIKGNYMGGLIVGGGLLALFETIRVQNSLKMARALKAQDGVKSSSTDENRNSTETAYEFVWNHKFPVDGETLWPPGKLLQLQRLAFSSHFNNKNHILFLYPEKLVIGEQTVPELAAPWGTEEWSFYGFYAGKTINEQSYDVSCIDKVELELSWMTLGITIWIKNGQERSKRIFKAGDVGVPKVIKELADECILQGIAQPSHKFGRTKEKDLFLFRRQLLHRIIEKQFRKCAPSAELNLVGEQISEEVFRRIVR